MMKYVMISQDINTLILKKYDVVEVKQVDEKSKPVIMFTVKNTKNING